MSDSEILRARESALLAVRRSARLIRRSRLAPPKAEAKPDGSLVTEVDRESERRLRGFLKGRHPDHGFLGEELPFEGGRSPWIWLLDPLDGTRVYSIGQDNCCVAATLTRDGAPVAGAIGSPFTGETYAAARGEAATVGGRPIRVAAARPLPEIELLVYYDMKDPGLQTLTSALARGEGGRVTALPGSFVLNAARAARGAYDAFLLVKRRGTPLMPWDLAPAALLLSAAGGVMRNFEGLPLGGMIPAREVVAGSPSAVDQIVARFGPTLRDPGSSLAWAHRNEAVFSRLYARILIAAGSGSPCLIGVGGAGGGVGKTSFARELAELLGKASCSRVALDDYLVPRGERDARGIGAHNPEASDLDRAAADLERLRAGEPARKPVYDHAAGRAEAEEMVEPRRFIIVDGVQALHPKLRPRMHLAVYLDADPAVRLRRVRRDVEEKGVSEAYARSVYERFEEDCRRFLLPLREAADVVLRVDPEFRLTWLSPEPADSR